MGLAQRAARHKRWADAPGRSAWLGRFGAEPPTFARQLFDLLVAAANGRPDTEGIGAAAQSLGVLRAQRGHAVAGLVEDLTALRAVLPVTADVFALVDAALTAAASAYVDELSAMLTARATRDPLTDLPNRAAFTEAIRHEIATGRRTSPPALLLIDLDGFKGVNDTDGHLAGDDVLVGVARLLRAQLRGGDLACRLGGDEFAVLLPRTTQSRAAGVARRLLAASHDAEGLASPSARVRLSIGVGWLAEPREHNDLIAVADAALYAVKALGGDGIELSRPGGPDRA